MRKDCNTCIYSHWDYESYYGGANRWFWTGCAKDHEDPEDDDCKDYKEWQSDED